MIVPYNKDKLALGQLKMARHLIDNVVKVCAIAKNGDYLYRCKQLKKVALPPSSSEKHQT
jgi:hypothetical protein